MAKSKIDAVYMITQEQIEEIVEKTVEACIGKMSDNMRFGISTLTCDKQEASEKLGVTRATVYKMIEDGRLRATSDGKRVVTESVFEYLNQRNRGKA